MIDVTHTARVMLSDAGYRCQFDEIAGLRTLLFENAQCLGVLAHFETSQALLEAWENLLAKFISQKQFALRRAGQKAWNAYLVVLSAEQFPKPQLAQIEEDLTGVRKIARSGIDSVTTLKRALLSLLPLQAAPEMAPIDMPVEIRSRATELPPIVVDAFLSDATQPTVLQALEEAK